MTTTRRILIPLLAVAAVAGGAETASADTPVQPRKLTVPLPPKGSADFLDFDHDGRWEHVRFDFDGDGTPEVIVQDTNGDGKYDVRWTDRNGDRKLDDDEMERLTKKAKRNRCTRQRRAPRCARNGRAHRVAGKRKPFEVTETVDEDAGTPATPSSPPSPVEVGQPEGAGQAPGQQQQPQAAGLPANVKPTGMTFDVDGDGEQETVHGDDTQGASGAYTGRSDADADVDDVVIGTKDGGRGMGVHNIDNDKNDQELVVTDPTLLPGQSYGRDLDGDGDIDLVVIGTKNGAEVGGAFQLDGDGNEEEVLVYDPSLASGQSYDLDLDGDGDGDVKVVGTK